MYASDYLLSWNLYISRKKEESKDDSRLLTHQKKFKLSAEYCLDFEKVTMSGLLKCAPDYKQYTKFKPNALRLSRY